MSVHASRAQVLAAALPVQPLAELSASAAPVSAAVSGLQASVASGAVAQPAAAKPAMPEQPPVTAAQAFATQAPANAEQAKNIEQGASNAVTVAPAPAPAVAGRPGTVATVAKPAAPVQSPATAGSIGGAVLALVLVVGLILALGWLAKRLPGFRGAGNTNALRVVSSLSLGPRERVVVVAVGETQLLIGVGAGGMRTLHTLEQPLPAPAPATTPAFAQLLSQHFGKKA